MVSLMSKYSIRGLVNLVIRESMIQEWVLLIVIEFVQPVVAMQHIVQVTLDILSLRNQYSILVM